MKAHVFSHMVLGKEGFHGGRCTCGFAPIRDKSKQVIEDQVIVHMRNVQRALAGLRRTASGPAVLKSERDWYRTQANDLSNSPEERELWGKLAEELSVRINDGTPVDDAQLSFDGLP